VRGAIEAVYFTALAERAIEGALARHQGKVCGTRLLPDCGLLLRLRPWRVVEQAETNEYLFGDDGSRPLEVGAGDQAGVHQPIDTQNRDMIRPLADTSREFRGPRFRHPSTSFAGHVVVTSAAASP
jgi:hypothetical protein